MQAGARARAARPPWAGLAPGNNESGGKRRSGKTRKGGPWLRAALVEAAHGTGLKKGTDFQAQCRHLVRRKGKKRAAVAVAHSIIVIAYHVIKEQRPYTDLGRITWIAVAATQPSSDWSPSLGHEATPSPGRSPDHPRLHFHTSPNFRGFERDSNHPLSLDCGCSYLKTPAQIGAVMA